GRIAGGFGDDGQDLVGNLNLKYSQSDQRKYLVPCLNCGTLEFLKWEQVRWRDNEPLTTHYLCEHCDFKHYEKDKIGMLSNGHWEPFAEFKGMAGFFINEVSSPWVTWAKMAEDFLKAKKEEDKLKVFTTESLGKPWQVRGESPEWEKLYNRREEYPIGLVPDRGIILTAGADVQKDRIEVEVMAWGKRKENWGVETLVFSGSPFEDEVWEDMDNLIEKEYLHQQGVKLPISRLSIDSGYATEEVYNWGRKYPRKVMIVKGTDRSLSPMSPPKTIEFNYKGEKLKRSAVLWLIGVSVIKTELLRWLNLNVSEDGKEFPKGFCHFPKYEAEFFKQITAENLIKKMVRGYATYQWEKTRARNEALDNRVYNRAATYNLGIDRWTDEDWKEIAENFGIQIPGEINNNVLKSGEIINNSVDNSGVKQSKLNSGRLRKRNSFVHG
ncbi:MAG: terminase gpA endonuclease subunit, partial [Candidatus Zixiibacteriota bacterium]